MKGAGRLNARYGREIKLTFICAHRLILLVTKHSVLYLLMSIE